MLTKSSCAQHFQLRRVHTSAPSTTFAFAHVDRSSLGGTPARASLSFAKLSQGDERARFVVCNCELPQCVRVFLGANHACEVHASTARWKKKHSHRLHEMVQCSTRVRMQRLKHNQLATRLKISSSSSSYSSSSYFHLPNFSRPFQKTCSFVELLFRSQLVVCLAPASKHGFLWEVSCTSSGRD